MNIFNGWTDKKSEDSEEQSLLFDLKNLLHFQPHQNSLKIYTTTPGRAHHRLQQACLTPNLARLTITQPDCNTTLRTVTRRRHSTGLYRRTSLVRVISSLLLVLIVYGTTIEAAHKHGRLFKAEASELSLSVSQPNAPTKVGDGRFGCSECLICQLQKNFSATLITVRVVSSQPRSRLELQIPRPTAFKSLTSAPHKGRGPPLTS